MANVAKVRETIAHIEKSVEASKASKTDRFVFEMSGYRNVIHGYEASDYGIEVSVAEVDDICGTAMCFAGWALDYENKVSPWMYDASDARRFLEMDQAEGQIFFDYDILTVADLKKAVNYWFHEDIYHPSDFEDATWEYVGSDIQRQDELAELNATAI